MATMTTLNGCFGGCFALLFEVKLDKHLLILHFLPQGAYIFGFLSWATTCHDRLLSLFLLSDAA